MKSSLTTLLICIVLAALGYGAYTLLSVQGGMQAVSKNGTETSTMAHPTTTSTAMMAASSSAVQGGETSMHASATPSQPAMKQSSNIETKMPTKEPVAVHAQVHTIAVSGYAFAPGTLTVHAGDTVVWKNGDQASHTITSDTGSELASDYFGKGMTVSHTFLQKGTYAYHCEPHPWMKGTIIVQ